MADGAILVTGATGFVGSHVMARAAELGLPVVASSGDLRDPAVARSAIEQSRPAAIVHLAARPRDRNPSGWDVLAAEVTMAGNLLRAADELVPGACVLVPGTAAQYGAGSPDPLPETAPTLPLSAYGAVRCALEVACLAPALRGSARVIWARSFNFIGPGQGLDAPVPSWARQVAEGETRGAIELRTGDLSVVRDFVDVRDVADAYLALVRSDFAGVVNVGSGDGVPLRRVVDLLVGRAMASAQVEEDAALRRAIDPPCVVADVGLLVSRTGWKRRFSLEQSVGDVLDEWRAVVAATPAAGR